jgi:diamine N-acetyltransferase
MTSLIEISQSNWEKCCSLSVDDDQKGYISSNVYSLAESKYEPERYPLGIDNNGQLVGFAMYGNDTDDDISWILRFMIDRAYQHKGLGRDAMEKLVQLLVGKYKTADIKLCVHPENSTAIRLYKNAGFSDTGEKWGLQSIFLRKNRNPAV